METERLQFTVDGEWLTDFVRLWFWNEDKPYDTCKELIGSCIYSDDDSIITEITDSILEGRKKFIGINEFELVDDNQKVRHISEKLEEVKHKNAIHEIELDIIKNGIRYVDPYSTVKSISEGKSKYNINTAEECSLYFQYGESSRYDLLNGYYAPTLPAVDSPTCAGLWLFYKPEIIYQATENRKVTVGSIEFWENVYQITKDWEGFQDRNKLYLAKVRASNKILAENPRNYSKVNSNLGYRQPPHIDNTLPCWSGLISPKGDFYPADFGEHESVAFHYIITHNTEYQNEVVWDRSLLILLKQGWIALRGIDSYIVEDATTYDYNSNWKPTREQKDIVWEQVLRHGLSSKVVDEKYY